MTMETLRAYKERGRPMVRITPADDARRVIGALPALGIDLDAITRDLESEGVRLFADSYQKALGTIAEKRRMLKAG
jgi:transaldolase